MNTNVNRVKELKDFSNDFLKKYIKMKKKKIKEMIYIIKDL